MKRLAVATALLTNQPRLMFLDEPTSGLDSSMAAEVIASLRRLQAEDGRTLVVTIHQPSMQVYSAFNKLLLLSGGRVAYFGPASQEPLEFFIDCGFPYEQGFNIAEYFIDTVTKSAGTANDACKKYECSFLSKKNAEEVQQITSIKLPLNALTINSESKSTPGRGKDSPYAHGILTELAIMIKYKEIPRWRYAIFWFTRLGLYVILAGLLSAFFWQQSYAMDGILNRNGILFISTILPSFMAQVHVEEIKFEREVYTREFHDSYYRPSNYVLAKILAELPMTILSSVAFSSILYWCVDLDHAAASFAFFCLAAFTNFTIAQLIGCSISAAVPGDVGPAALLPILSTLMMLVGGFFVRASTIQPIWKWLYRISYVQWSWSSIMVNEYHAREFYDHCDSETGGLDGLINQLALPESSVRLLRLFFSNQSSCDPITGVSILRTFNLEDRNRFTSLLYAALSIPVFYATFYYGVSRVRHEKR
jgi:ABC-type multidrug transport system permease subunit